MKFTKFDIGADIISILTRGMYPDPKDALREYIQNGVDAKAKKINVRIRQNNIVVEDNGIGMNYDTIRRAARIGVSDKNPSKDVGFMGIGIYSAYHLCDNLVITSKFDDKIPNRLSMNFKGMKSLLKEQKELRLGGEIDSEKLIDLQSLLEQFVSLTDEDELSIDDFPEIGTRVEMKGVSDFFYSEISDFELTSKYLQDVVPLRFDPNTFKFADEIEKSIIEACIKNGSNIELIDLNLQVNSQSKDLYKPYSDIDFENGIPIEPKIEEIKYNDVFFGVIWGCLNSGRKKISNRDLRGFLIKKQGFAIGKRSDMVKHFQRGNTFFDRYIGEIIITNNSLLPNASRNDIEYSPLREIFITSLREEASGFDEFANKYQEECKADERLNEIILLAKEYNATLAQNLQNTDGLFDLNKKISPISDELERRIKTKRIKESRLNEAKELSKELKKIISFIKYRILLNNSPKIDSDNKPPAKKNPTQEITNKLEEFQSQNSIVVKEMKFESLIQLIDDLEFKYDENVKFLLEIIDERFIQAASSSKDDYYKSLELLRQEFLFEEE